jgi:hypothetical protein
LREWIGTYLEVGSQPLLGVKANSDGDWSCSSTAHHWHPNVNCPKCRNGRERGKKKEKEKP